MTLELSPSNRPAARKNVFTTMKPTIGITTYGYLEHGLTTAHYDQFYMLPVDYVTAVQQAGGMPVLLPPADGLFPDILSRIDGIVFTGGCDVDPVHYGGDRSHPALTPLDGERDRAELNAMRATISDGNTPMLCVCRGLQVLNVALGGTLVEHIEDLGRGDMHRDENGHWTLHESRVAPDSRTAKALGGASPVAISGHHQGLGRLAAGLSVTSRAEDGIVEAVELADHPWCVGVQWHPEITAASDPSQQGLFDALIAATRQSS